MEYIAFIHIEEDSYVATVPDLNYTSSFGETFKHAVHNIVEACELYCEDLDELPKASTLEELRERGEVEDGAIPQLINVKSEKNVRVNVMMRADVLKRATKKAEITHGGNRSAYIQELVDEDTLEMA